ncbi:MAG: OadG family protein [Clostridia bacterium]|nr:OadG family protein [Clostridia bacterium]
MENMFTKEFYSASVEGLGDKLIFGGSMLLIGMATVFAVLALLMACLYLFQVVFHGTGKKEKCAPKEDAVAAPTLPTAPVMSREEEIVAVIAAAIAMAESEGSGMKFRVVSFKRK